MKKLLIGAASALALSTGVANAQLSQDEMISRIQAGGIEEITIVNDCEGVICAVDGAETPAEAMDAVNEFLANAEGFEDGVASINDPETRVAGRRQTVFLNFDAGGDPTFIVDVVFLDGSTGTLTFNDFVYTPEIRDAIQARMEEDYEGYRFRFAQSAPRRGEFTTLNIGDNDRAPGDANITLFETPTGGFSFSILFGMANEIDFGNENLSTAAFTDASFWVLLAEMFPAALGPLTGIPTDPADPASIAATLEEAVLNQSANTSAHELGHVVGLRHQDSYGPIGGGAEPSDSPFEFLPPYAGPFAADETFNHLMASGASTGLPIQSSSSEDRFFSERSAIKLTTNERGLFVNEADIGPDGIPFRPLNAVNTIVEGDNAGPSFLNFDGAVIVGDISVATEIDSYAFSAEAGDFLNIEQIAFSDGTFSDSLIFSKLSVFQVADDGTETLLVENILGDAADGFVEAFILDFEVPETGDYVLRVGGVLDDFPTQPTDTLEGAYQIHFYIFDEPFDTQS